METLREGRSEHETTSFHVILAPQAKRHRLCESQVSTMLPAKLSGCATCAEMAGRTTLSPGVQVRG